MNFNLERSHEILGRKPVVLRTLLQDLHQDCIINNEGSELGYGWKK